MCGRPLLHRPYQLAVVVQCAKHVDALADAQAVRLTELGLSGPIRTAPADLD